ncbi:MAG: bile acid:sodium symporter [Desulfobacterales bacterium]|nr:bile acid:sodium symporter [Desulfobacterales bacterium]
MRKYWFLVGLVLIFIITLVDVTETVSGLGKWLKARHGPDAVIVLIFFFSGLLLDAGQIRSGLKDVAGTLIALVVIFVISPVLASMLGLLPMSPGIKIGLFLVAVMPTTLSSGVVMTGASGGNMAHALLITILANIIAVFSIPFALSLLLSMDGGGGGDVSIDKAAIMIKLGCLVLAPLFLGIIGKHPVKRLGFKIGRRLNIVNQCCILSIVWMALSHTREAIIQGGGLVGAVLALAFVFHGLLLASAAFMARAGQLGRGRMESVLFMGAQKTLPLSIIIQISLFPQYGLALVVCVVHHIVHLLMDGYLVGRLTRPPAKGGRP